MAGILELTERMQAEFSEAIAKTDYHVRVRHNDLWFDVYRNDAGRIKLLRPGSTSCKNCWSLELLVDGIRQTTRPVGRGSRSRPVRRTAKAAAEHIATKMAYAMRAIPEDLNEFVIADAGWEPGGAAQVGFVHVRRVAGGVETSGASWPATAETSQEAEVAAIEYAASYSASAVILSDCGVAVEIMRHRYPDRVMLVTRRVTRAADLIANKRRGK